MHVRPFAAPRAAYSLDESNGRRERRAMLSLAFSAAMLGIDGYIVRVQADTSPGSPLFTIIGLPDRALKEANHRVRSAIWNSGFTHPPGRVLVNLSPADV